MCRTLTDKNCHFFHVLRSQVRVQPQFKYEICIDTDCCLLAIQSGVSVQSVCLSCPSVLSVCLSVWLTKRVLSVCQSLLLFYQYICLFVRSLGLSFCLSVWSISLSGLSYLSYPISSISSVCLSCLFVCLMCVRLPCLIVCLILVCLVCLLVLSVFLVGLFFFPTGLFVRIFSLSVFRSVGRSVCLVRLSFQSVCLCGLSVCLVRLPVCLICLVYLSVYLFGLSSCFVSLFCLFVCLL